MNAADYKSLCAGDAACVVRFSQRGPLYNAHWFRGRDCLPWLQNAIREFRCLLRFCGVASKRLRKRVPRRHISIGGRLLQSARVMLRTVDDRTASTYHYVELRRRGDSGEKIVLRIARIGFDFPVKAVVVGAKWVARILNLPIDVAHIVSTFVNPQLFPVWITSSQNTSRWKTRLVPIDYSVIR